MPDPIPTDDLYARLGVPADAESPAIDRAWRALLKRHHPDIAGSMSLEIAKLINVAHDWLRDPVRRARYDMAIRQRAGRRAPATAASARRPTTPRRTWPRGAPARRSAPPDDLDDVFGASAPAIRSFLAQVAALTDNDIDRLSVSDPVDPVVELRDLIPPELWLRIDALNARLAAAAAPAAMLDPRVVAAARAFGHALVLELFLWYYLADPEPMLEGMRRGWESAVGLPRYGPNTDEVTQLIARLGQATAGQAAALAGAWDGFEEHRPWPADAHEFDFAALEVSAALARRDAVRAASKVAGFGFTPDAGQGAGPGGGPDPGSGSASGADPAAARRWGDAFASTAHVVTLRPIFAPRAYARYQRTWGALGGPAARRPIGEAPTATVRRA